jgi:phosphonopyruvate decarboxylase
MLDPQKFVEYLQANAVEFFTGVPDSLLKDLCRCFEHLSRADQHIIAANEGGAIAMALGYHLATGKIPLVYLQNSGLGNIINPLLSLADGEVYAIPMVIVIGWRGEPGVPDEPQHKKQGRVMLPMLEAMGIPYSVIGQEMDDPKTILADALRYARKSGAPYALVIKKGVFKSFSAARVEELDLELSREEAIQMVIDVLGETDVVVSTTGMASREVYEYRHNKGAGHHRDFLTVGGMGHASNIALSIALRRPERMVYCLDGDGSLLMHMGALCINGSLKPRNLKHIILNNGAHDSVGGQATVGLSVDLLAIAGAAGYKYTARVWNKEDVQSGLLGLRNSNGPGLLEFRVRRGARKDLSRPTTTPIQNKNAFMDFLK